MTVMGDGETVVVVEAVDMWVNEPWHLSTYPAASQKVRASRIVHQRSLSKTAISSNFSGVKAADLPT